jgi:PleD family two-component response regulator
MGNSKIDRENDREAETEEKECLNIGGKRLRIPEKLIPSIKVLIIEDNHVDARMFEKAVDICGFTSLVAYGMVGLESKWPENHAPRLIILDYQLPDMNGADVLKGLRCKNRDSRRTSDGHICLGEL